MENTSKKANQKISIHENKSYWLIYSFIKNENLFNPAGLSFQEVRLEEAGQGTKKLQLIPIGLDINEKQKEMKLILEIMLNKLSTKQKIN